MARYAAIMIVFLLLLYYLSKYIVKQRNAARGVDLTVGETVRLGSDSFIYVLLYKGKKYIIAQNKQSITLIDKLDGDGDSQVDAQFGDALEEALKLELDSEGSKNE